MCVDARSDYTGLTGRMQPHSHTRRQDGVRRDKAERGGPRVSRGWCVAVRTREGVGVPFDAIDGKRIVKFGDMLEANGALAVEPTTGELQALHA